MDPNVGAAYNDVNDNNSDVDNIGGYADAMTMRPYHHGNLRSVLLEAALAVLRERGVDALSLRELAREIGVSHAAPSRHFKDKQDLLDAIAIAGFERLGDALEKARTTDGDFTAQLRATSKAYVDFAVNDAPLLAVMYGRNHDPGVSEKLRTASRKFVESAPGLIVEGQRSGQVRQGNVERIALVFFVAVHGFASLRSSGVLPPDDKALDDLVEDVLRAIGPDKHSTAIS